MYILNENALSEIYNDFQEMIMWKKIISSQNASELAEMNDRKELYLESHARWRAVVLMPFLDDRILDRSTFVLALHFCYVLFTAL